MNKEKICLTMQIRTIQQRFGIKSNKYKIYANVAWKMKYRIFFYILFTNICFFSKEKWMSWMPINTILFHNLIRRLEQKRIVKDFCLDLYIKYSNIFFFVLILPTFSHFIAHIVLHINLKFFTHHLSSLIFNLNFY